MGIKILVMTPYALDANSFWRCVGPMSYLESESKGEIELIMGDLSKGVSWPEVMRCDIVFLHRPCRNEDLMIMQVAYNLKKPIWVEFDDWLFDLPSWNPHAPLYHSNQLQLVMAKALACADLISVSTQELYTQYRKVNRNVVIIPNSYRSDLFTYREEKLRPRKKIGFWRGSNTHDGDLLSVKNGFQKLNNMIHFMGGASWLLLSALDPSKYQVKQNHDVIMYFKQIYDQDYKVMVFPLVDCLFNRCKSNIAYQEAIHAGALCIAPDMPEWKREGVIAYKPHDSDSFAEAVNQAFEVSDDDHEEILQTAFKSMKISYDISSVNEIRKQVVHHLLTEDHNKVDFYDQTIPLRTLAILKSGASLGVESREAKKS